MKRKSKHTSDAGFPSERKKPSRIKVREIHEIPPVESVVVNPMKQALSEFLKKGRHNG